MAGDYAGPDDTQLIREELGLDKPVMQQFFEWVGRTARGDLGSSIFSGISVVELVRLKIGATLSLTLTGGLLAILIGVPTGVLAAWKSGSLIDRIIQVWAAAGISIPGFWLGYMMIWGFSVNLRLFPVIGYGVPYGGLRPMAPAHNPAVFAARHYGLGNHHPHERAASLLEVFRRTTSGRLVRRVWPKPPYSSGTLCAPGQYRSSRSSASWPPR